MPKDKKHGAEIKMQLDKPEWSFRLPKERNVCSRRPVIRNDRAYIVMFYDKRGFTESVLLALDLSSGTKLWSYVVEHVCNEPVVTDNGIVYLSSFEGNIYALDNDGQLLWKFPGTSTSLGVPVLAGTDRLVVSQLSGHPNPRKTWCLKASTGETLWAYQHDGHGYPIWADSERVFHSSAASTLPGQPSRCTLFGLSVDNGALLWSVTDSDYIFNPVVDKEYLFVCSHRAIRAYSSANGNLLSELILEENKHTLRLPRFGQRDRLYVWRDDHLGATHSLRGIQIEMTQRLFGGPKLTFSVAWSLDEPRGLCAAPIELSADMLLYLTKDGNICILDSATGNRISETKLKTQPGMFGDCVLAGDDLLIAHSRDILKFGKSSRLVVTG